MEKLTQQMLLSLPRDPVIAFQKHQAANLKVPNPSQKISVTETRNLLSENNCWTKDRDLKKEAAQANFAENSHHDLPSDYAFASY